MCLCWCILMIRWVSRYLELNLTQRSRKSSKNELGSWPRHRGITFNTQIYFEKISSRVIDENHNWWRISNTRRLSTSPNVSCVDQRNGRFLRNFSNWFSHPCAQKVTRTSGGASNIVKFLKSCRILILISNYFVHCNIF